MDSIAVFTFKLIRRFDVPRWSYDGFLS
jgi:hypothetical protein